MIHYRISGWIRIKSVPDCGCLCGGHSLPTTRGAYVIHIIRKGGFVFDRRVVVDWVDAGLVFDSCAREDELMFGYDPRGGRRGEKRVPRSASPRRVGRWIHAPCELPQHDSNRIVL